MKTISFAGFKVKVITSRLIPKNKIYAFPSPKEAKNFIEILQGLDLLLKCHKIGIIKTKPKGRIIRPS